MSAFIKRQNDPGNNPDDPSWWYYSDTAVIIKWVICGAIFVAIVLFIVGGYFHAQRRMRKGKPPLKYHMWLVSRQQRDRFFPPAQNPYVFYRTGGQAYPMQPYGPAPPAYQQEDYVPAYSPPEGASKVDPDQHRNYAPPSGPPPNHNIAGSSNLDAARTTGPSQPLRE